MKKLIIFGVGGILLNDGVNPLVDILGLLNKQDEALRLQKQYELHKEKGPWGLTQYAKLYQGESREHLLSITIEYLSERLRPEAQKTLHALKERGYIIGAMSAHPDFVMEALKDMLEFDFSEGTNFEYRDGITTGNLARELNRNTKCEVLEEVVKRFEVTANDSAIVANSITQVPLIERVGTYVAFNQHRDLGHKPDFEVKSGSFSELLGIFQ